jgi:hypothetical protein
VPQPYDTRLKARRGRRDHQLDRLAGMRAPAIRVADQLAAGIVDDARHA